MFLLSDSLYKTCQDYKQEQITEWIPVEIISAAIGKVRQTSDFLTY